MRWLLLCCVVGTVAEILEPNGFSKQMQKEMDIDADLFSPVIDDYLPLVEFSEDQLEPLGVEAATLFKPSRSRRHVSSRQAGYNFPAEASTPATPYQPTTEKPSSNYGGEPETGAPAANPYTYKKVEVYKSSSSPTTHTTESPPNPPLFYAEKSPAAVQETQVPASKYGPTSEISVSDGSKGMYHLTDVHIPSSQQKTSYDRNVDPDLPQQAPMAHGIGNGGSSASVRAGMKQSVDTFSTQTGRNEALRTSEYLASGYPALEYAITGYPTAGYPTSGYRNIVPSPPRSSYQTVVYNVQPGYSQSTFYPNYSPLYQDQNVYYGQQVYTPAVGAANDQLTYSYSPYGTTYKRNFGQLAYLG